MRALDGWNGYHVAPTVTVDSIAPDDDALDQVGGLVSGGFLERSQEWKEFSASGHVTRPPPVVPKHLEHIQGRNAATAGAWALDVIIERQENHSRYSNERHAWYFPRRLRFYEAFCSPYEGKGWSRELRFPRANSDGQLVLFTEFGEDPPLLNIPNDETAFRYGLGRGDAWPPFHRLEVRERRRGAFSWSQPSDKGRYLIGTLRLFGGLRSAASVLLHSYWRGLFEELGGAIGATRRNQIKDTFRKKVRTVTTRPSEWTEDIWDRLAAIVAAEAHQVRIPQQSLSFDQLRKRHEPYIKKERAALAEQGTEDPQDWIDRATHSLPRGVKDLCARRVLFQGYEWRCDTCFNTNWNDLSALSAALSCAICGVGEAAPVDEPWNFRLNGFLQDAMREHGLLALVWCLIELSNRAQKTFYFLGPHDLWNEQPRDDRAKRDHEADLIAVVDAKVHLCEAKSSSRDIDLESLIEVAKRLRPDVVTLAVMEAASPRSAANLEKLKLALADTDIQSELLTLQEDPDWHTANLP